MTNCERRYVCYILCHNENNTNAHCQLAGEITSMHGQKVVVSAAAMESLYFLARESVCSHH